MKTREWITILAGLAFIVVCILAANKAHGQPFPEIGRQHPYISTASALTTQIVTTVYEVKFLRVIERTAGGALETNFATLRTNIISVTQTNSPLRPE